MTPRSRRFRPSQRGGIFAVLAGAVAIVDRSGDDPRTVTVYQSGECTSDINILSPQRPVVGAVARGDTEVLQNVSTDLRRIIEERPALGEIVLRAFIARRALLVDADTDQVLGAAMLAAQGGEVMTEIQVAMQARLPYTALQDVIFAHPTMAEGLNDLFGRLE